MDSLLREAVFLFLESFLWGGRGDTEGAEGLEKPGYIMRWQTS